MNSFSFCSHFVVACQFLGLLSVWFLGRSVLLFVLWNTLFVCANSQSSIFQIIPNTAPGRRTLCISFTASGVANLGSKKTSISQRKRAIEVKKASWKGNVFLTNEKPIAKTQFRHQQVGFFTTHEDSYNMDIYIYI